MPLLKLHNISKAFELDGVKLKILDKITLEIQKGEFIAIMGPSGSGKSTLMYIMGCLDTPTSGQIYLEGKSLFGVSESKLAHIRNQKIGFVFQMFNLLPRTTALANVELPLVYAQVPSLERKKRALRLLNKLGLADRTEHFSAQLSGGEQQRVAIARALINNPSLVLADEPTGNLDSKSGKEIMEILKQFNKEGNTIVIVTHDPAIARYAQKIIRIQDGKIVRNH